MALDQYKAIETDIINLLKTKNQVVIAIDGMSASGKSTLSEYLKHQFYARVIHMDDFFLQDHQRTDERLNEIGGNIDYERFEKEVVEAIKNQKDIIYHKYDCQDQTMTEKFIKKDYHLLIIEGAYALRPNHQSIYDLTYLMVVEADIQRARLELRNKDMVQRFLDEWIPLENRYIDACNLKALVDRVIKHQ